MPVYSHSRLKSFEQCPLQYRFRYLDRIPAEVENVEAFTGKVVHATLEAFFRDGETGDLASALDRFEQFWRERWSPRVRVVKSGVTAEDYRAIGRRCVENFFRMEGPPAPGETRGVEERITVRLDPEGRYRMQGFIDRLAQAPDGTWEIHDYKTGSSVPGQAELDADRQLALYQLGLEERIGGAAPVRLVWHYLYFGRRLESARSAAQLESLRGDLITRIRTVEARREFPARVSSLCRWCEYEEICPARREAVARRREETRERVEEGARLVDGYVDLLRECAGPEWEFPDTVRQAREALLEFSRRAGTEAVVGKTHVARIRRREGLRLPPAGTERRDALEAYLLSERLWDGKSDPDPDRILREIDLRPGAAALRETVANFGSVEKTREIQLLPLGGGQLKFFE